MVWVKLVHVETLGDADLSASKEVALEADLGEDLDGHLDLGTQCITCFAEACVIYEVYLCMCFIIECMHGCICFIYIHINCGFVLQICILHIYKV